MAHRLSRQPLAVLAFAATMAALRLAAAQSNKVAAEALFEEARRLVADGNPAEACPKFADSQRLDPTPGTLLNLASCYEKLGRSATAWATYKEAASLASATGRGDLVTTAMRHAEGLSPRLSRLTLLAPSAPEGLQIVRDGVLTAPAERGMAIPVDPGKHTIEARAPRKKPWSGTVDVADGAASEKLVIPVLDDAPAPVESSSRVDAASTTSVSSADTSQAASSAPGLAPQRMVALGSLGVAVVGLGVGTAFAVTAHSKYETSLASCPNDKNLCSSQGVATRDDARAAGNVATVAFGVGAVALVTAAGLWFLAPSQRPQTAASTMRTSSLQLRVTPTVGGAMVGGQW
jgi:hypothetical protein